MKKIIYTGLYFLTLIGCNNTNTENIGSTTTENLIIGNWYFFNEDSLYNELYIDSINFIMKNILVGLVDYKYEFHDDTLFIYLGGSEKHKYGIPEFISNNEFLIKIRSNYSIIFHRLEETNISKNIHDYGTPSFYDRAYKYSRRESGYIDGDSLN